MRHASLNEEFPFPALLSTLKSQELKARWHWDVGAEAESQDLLWFWVRFAELITRHREAVRDGADATQLTALHEEIESLASRLDRVANVLAHLSQEVRQLHEDVDRA